MEYKKQIEYKISHSKYEKVDPTYIYQMPKSYMKMLPSSIL